MPNRWIILAALFLARTSMAYQFQSVAALSPLIVDRYGVSLADIGLLIGLYMAPGVVIAIPGGALAARFGDKRIVGLSMILMLLAMPLIAFGPGWQSLAAGRLLGGVGGIALNIVMTKMVADWFAGREISTAMGIFINSWPVGIALALLTLPILAASGGLALAWAGVTGLIAVALVAFLLLYAPPPGAAARATGLGVARFPVWPLFLAGSVWALYNTALAMVFSFGPAFLSDRGASLTSASSISSLFMLVISVSVPIGGILADRSRRPDTVIIASLLGYAVLMPLAQIVPVAAVPAILILAGAIFGLGAGPIVGLPALALPPASRAFGMGVFYAIYYAWMMGAPILAGAIADWTGRVGTVFLFGAILNLAAILALMLFRRTPGPAAAGAAPNA